MSVNLPTVDSDFTNPKDSKRISRVWYRALQGLNDQVQAQVVTSVNISGNNGITAQGGPITSNGVFSLFIGNLTCANAQIAGTVTSARAIVQGTVTAADIVANASLRAASEIVSGTITTANAIITGQTTAVDVALSGVFRFGNAFTASVTTAAGWITVQDSSGTTFKVLCQR
jgi:hypothetical protein